VEPLGKHIVALRYRGGKGRDIHNSEIVAHPARRSHLGSLGPYCLTVGSFLRPVGPLADRVYWFRRSAVVVVALVAVLGLRSCAMSGSPPSAGSPVALPSAVTSPLVGSAAAAATAPTATSAGSLTGQKKPTTSGAPAPNVPLCTDAATSVTLTTDLPSYPTSATPQLTLKVRNGGTTTCRRDIGQGALELSVLSGTAVVWSSDHCAPGGASEFRTLRPGEEFRITRGWPRTKSTPGCPTPAGTAGVGTYSASGRAGTKTSTPSGFALN
jgi:hypothetical protein